MNLVDNRDFLIWSLNFNAESTNDPIFEPMPPYPDFDEKLSSSAGATPFTTVEDLESALNAIFYQRADAFLEHPAILDLPPRENLESCSDETQMVGFSI